MHNPHHSWMCFDSRIKGWKTVFCTVFHSSKRERREVPPSPMSSSHRVTPAIPERTFLTLLYTNAVTKTPENEPARR